MGETKLRFLMLNILQGSKYFREHLSVPENILVFTDGEGDGGEGVSWEGQCVIAGISA